VNRRITYAFHANYLYIYSTRNLIVLFFTKASWVLRCKLSTRSRMKFMYCRFAWKYGRRNWNCLLKQIIKAEMQMKGAFNNVLLQCIFRFKIKLYFLVLKTHWKFKERQIDLIKSYWSGVNQCRSFPKNTSFKLITEGWITTSGRQYNHRKILELTCKLNHLWPSC
jgi:hypothetical protein